MSAHICQIITDSSNGLLYVLDQAITSTDDELLLIEPVWKTVIESLI